MTPTWSSFIHNKVRYTCLVQVKSFSKVYWIKESNNIIAIYCEDSAIHQVPADAVFYSGPYASEDEAKAVLLVLTRVL